MFVRKTREVPTRVSNLVTLVYGSGGRRVKVAYPEWLWTLHLLTRVWPGRAPLHPRAQTPQACHLSWPGFLQALRSGLISSQFQSATLRNCPLVRYSGFIRFLPIFLSLCNFCYFRLSLFHILLNSFLSSSFCFSAANFFLHWPLSFLMFIWLHFVFLFFSLLYRQIVLPYLYRLSAFFPYSSPSLSCSPRFPSSLTV